VIELFVLGSLAKVKAFGNVASLCYTTFLGRLKPTYLILHAFGSVIVVPNQTFVLG
jgi:hypothetical protein